MRAASDPGSGTVDRPTVVQRSTRASPTVAVARSLSRRVLVAVATVVAVSMLVFAAIEIVPIDPAMHALGRESTPEQRALFRQRMHLDDPPLARYLRWGGNIMRGDFGTSVTSGRPVAPLLAQRLRNTAILGVTALVVSVVVGLPLAVWAARHRESPLDLGLSIGAIAITSVPEFVLALLILLLFASQLRWFPVTSTGVAEGEYAGLVLPIVVLSLAAIAYIFRLARVSIVETLAAPYVRTAVLNGFSPNRILWRHVLPNAGAVIVNVIALNAIFLLSGVIVIENVFAYPGIGTLMVQAIQAKDLPIVEAVAVVTAAILVTVSLIADGLVLLAVPRLRTRGAGRH
ncbi:MAG: transporter permease [Thermomicrobiales bacterium]|nr:transporter permease [Thermomicrobiales bacterium]